MARKVLLLYTVKAVAESCVVDLDLSSVRTNFLI